MNHHRPPSLVQLSVNQLTTMGCSGGPKGKPATNCNNHIHLFFYQHQTLPGDQIQNRNNQFQLVKNLTQHVFYQPQTTPDRDQN